MDPDPLLMAAALVDVLSSLLAAPFTVTVGIPLQSAGCRAFSEWSAPSPLFFVLPLIGTASFGGAGAVPNGLVILGTLGAGMDVCDMGMCMGMDMACSFPIDCSVPPCKLEMTGGGGWRATRVRPPLLWLCCGLRNESDLKAFITTLLLRLTAGEGETKGDGTAGLVLPFLAPF